MYVCLCVGMCNGVQVPREARAELWSTAAGITDGCELHPDMGAGKRAPSSARAVHTLRYWAAPAASEERCLTGWSPLCPCAANFKAKIIYQVLFCFIMLACYGEQKMWHFDIFFAQNFRRPKRELYNFY